MVSSLCNQNIKLFCIVTAWKQRSGLKSINKGWKWGSTVLSFTFTGVETIELLGSWCNLIPRWRFLLQASTDKNFKFNYKAKKSLSFWNFSSTEICILGVNYCILHFWANFFLTFWKLWKFICSFKFLSNEQLIKNLHSGTSLKGNQETKS